MTHRIVIPAQAGTFKFKMDSGPLALPRVQNDGLLLSVDDEGWEVTEGNLGFPLFVHRAAAAGDLCPPGFIAAAFWITCAAARPE
jgi:hypothetical protein